MDLPDGKFGCVLADPPWRFQAYSEETGLKKSPQQHYQCMTIEDIYRLPVPEIMAEDAVLWLWATWPMLPLALQTIDYWGLTYKSGGAWAKQSSTGRKWAFGTGYIFRSASEPFLIATKGKPKQAVRNIRNLIVSPVREHSRKPEDVYKTLEELYPNVPKIELFARQRREGWSAWGLEVGKYGSSAESTPTDG